MSENRALDAYNQGVMCWSQGKFQEALRFYNEALRLDDKMANAYGNRGIVRAALKDYKGALEDYSRAIKYDPQNYHSYYNRAQIKEKIDDVKGAIQDYTTAHTLNPNDEGVVCNRGIAYRLAGNYDSALTDLAAALRLKPDDWIAYFNRGSIKMSVGQFEGAVEDLTRCIDLNPNMDQAYHQRALTYALMGDVTRATAECEYILATFPNYRLLDDAKALLWQLGARHDDPLLGVAASVLMRFAYEQCGPRHKYAGFLGQSTANARWEVLTRPMYLFSATGFEREIAGASLDLLSRPHILIRVSPAKDAQFDVALMIQAPVAQLPIPGFVELSVTKISATAEALYDALQSYVQQKKLINKKNRLLWGNLPMQAKMNKMWIFQAERPADDEA